MTTYDNPRVSKLIEDIQTLANFADNFVRSEHPDEVWDLVKKYKSKD